MLVVVAIGILFVGVLAIVGGLLSLTVSRYHSHTRTDALQYRIQQERNAYQAFRWEHPRASLDNFSSNEELRALYQSAQYQPFGVVGDTDIEFTIPAGLQQATDMGCLRVPNVTTTAQFNAVRNAAINENATYRWVAATDTTCAETSSQTGTMAIVFPLQAPGQWHATVTGATQATATGRVVRTDAGSTWDGLVALPRVRSGAYYWEVTVTALPEGTSLQVGVADALLKQLNLSVSEKGAHAGAIDQNGQVTLDGATVTTGVALAAGDTLSFALTLSSNPKTLTIYRNCTVVANAVSLSTGWSGIAPALATFGSGVEVATNFGQREAPAWRCTALANTLKGQGMLLGWQAPHYAAESVAPSLALQVPPLLPSTLVGATSTAQPLTVTNFGGESVAVSQITAAAPFAVTNACNNRTLEPGQSCTAAITAHPTAVGSAEAVVQVIVSGETQIAAQRTVQIEATAPTP